MRSLSSRARLYIWATLLTGGAALIWQLGRLNGEKNSWLILVVSATASVAQVLKVEGATAKSSYNISWLVYGFAFALWGAPTAMLVVLVAHLAEWVWHKYPWFIQMFNIATYALAIQAASLAYGWANSDPASLNFSGIFGLLAAMAAFTFLNHLMVGLVIKLARGESLAQSGVFGALTLMIDFSLLCLGAAAALIWTVTPFAIVLPLIPLYLIYSTLKVPALQRQTQIDSKTGLYNSRHLISVLTQELARADRFDRPLTVVMADLDLLRNINNTYGHLAGDVVLVGIAHLLQKAVRDYDVVARFGGEEFCILMPETSPQDARARIEAIRTAVESAAFEVSTSLTPIKATMSFGIAGREQFGQSAHDLLHNADLAVYQAKLTGRNRVCIASADTHGDLGGVPLPGTTQGAGSLPVSPLPAETSTPAPTPVAQRASTGSPEPEAHPHPAVKPRPAWQVNVYIGGVALAALGLLGLTLRYADPPDWIGLGLFALIVLLAEWLAIDIYARDVSVSTSAAPFVAGAILFGPPGAVVLAVILAGAALAKHRSPLNRFVFNVGNHTISGLLCAGLIALSGRPFTNELTFVQIGLSLLSACLVYLSSTLLVAGAMHLSSGEPFRTVWVERFSWLAPSYLALGAVAYALIFGYAAAGLAGVVVILVPLLMLRFSQVQYLSRTTALVQQLRATNAELSRRSDEISRLNEELLLALSNTIDLRDPYVQGHSQHVARYAVLVAQELGLPSERVEVVRKAGLLHDIGKLGIPETILFKPDRLTAAEYETIKQHVTLGAEIIGAVHSLHQLIPLVRHHHEWYNGRGYPDGLRGHDIPLEARILSVADAVEAMASDRPYRLGMDSASILAEIQAHAGTQFDPVVVAAFCRVAQREREGDSVIVNSAREIATPSGVAGAEAFPSFVVGAPFSQAACVVGD